MRFLPKLLKTAWKDPVWSKVISAGIVFVLGSAATLRFLGTSWATIWHALTYAWDVFNTPVSVPLGALVLLGMVFFALLYPLLASLRPRHNKVATIEVAPAPPKPEATPERDYLGDNLFGFMWRWKVNSERRVGNVKMFCLACDQELMIDDCEDWYGQKDNRIGWTCDNCGYRAGVANDRPHELYIRVQREAERRMRTGEWKMASGPAKLAP